MKFFSFSDKGSRSSNEDFILSSQISAKVSLHVVADGMGGYANGEIASRIVAQSLCRYMNENIHKFSPRKLIENAILFANDSLSDERRVRNSRMGTTIAGLLLVDKVAYAFWMGDSRIYQIRSDEVIFESEDHSLINELRKVRQLTLLDIELYGAIVTRCLMGDKLEASADIIPLNRLPNDVFIICSDGLYKNKSVYDLYKEGRLTTEYLSQISEEMDDNYSVIVLL